MSNFTRAAAAYIADGSDAQGRRVCLILMNDIGPADRLPSVPVFKNSDFEGITARERVLRIFTGFVHGAAIPPIELVRTMRGQHPYKITHGYHRLYCSLAAGFSHVPAVRGYDTQALDNLEESNDEELC